MQELPAIRRVVVASRLSSLDLEITALEQELLIKKRLLELLNWEYSDCVIEQAELQRVSAGQCA